MKNQQGSALIVFLVIVFSLFAFIYGAKIATIYFQSMTVQKVFDDVVKKHSANDRTGEILETLDKQMKVEHDLPISLDDVEIEREYDHLMISASYEKIVPLFGNASLVFSFNPSAKN